MSMCKLEMEAPLTNGYLNVDVTLSDDEARSPLWITSFYGHGEVIERLIASGRDLGDLDKRGRYDGGEYTP